MNTIRGKLRGSRGVSFFAFQDVIMSVTGVVIVIALILALQIDKVRTPGSPAPIDGISTDEDSMHASQEKLEELETELMRLGAEVSRLHSAARSSESKKELDIQIKRLEERIGEVSQRLANKYADLNRGNADPVKLAAVEALIKEVEEANAQLNKTSQENKQMAIKLQELEGQRKNKESSLIEAKQQERDLVLIPELGKTAKEPIVLQVSGKEIVALKFDSGQVNAVKDFQAFCQNFKPLDHYFVFFFRPSGIKHFDRLSQAAKDLGFEIGYDAIEEGTQLQWEK